MGLDTSHDCWHGPYSAFTRWRNRLATAAGIKVEPVKYADGMTFDTADIDWERIERENPGYLHGEWRTVEAEPLVYLLAHSDCDGVIKPAQAAPLADRLAELLPLLGCDDGGAVGNHHRTTQRFIDGLRRAVAADEAVDFH